MSTVEGNHGLVRHPFGRKEEVKTDSDLKESRKKAKKKRNKGRIQLDLTRFVPPYWQE
jgi:hypothetical protein